MRTKFIAIFAALTILLMVCICYLFLSPSEERYDFKSPEEWLAALTPSQIKCVEQVTDRNSVVYVETQADGRSFGVGYTASDGIYAAMIQVNQGETCQVELKDQFTTLEDVFGNKYVPAFKKIQKLELTADETPEIYVWLALYGAPRDGNDQYYFYTKRANGLYEIAYYALACADWSSVEFAKIEHEDRLKIILIDDKGCDERRGKYGTSRIEFFLNNEGVEIIDIIETKD